MGLVLDPTLEPSWRGSRASCLQILVPDVAGRLERHGDLFEPLLAAERPVGFDG